MMMSEDKGTVEIPEVTVVEPQPEVVVEDLKELSSAEKEMAEKSGIVKKEVVDEKKEDKPPVEDTDKADVSNQTFEDTEKNEAVLIKNYNKNEQALYWKWKHDKRERQSAQAERDLALVREKSLKGELEKIRNNSTLSVEKLNKINKVLTGPADEITVEALQAIINETPGKVEDKEKPLTVKDFEEIQGKQKQEAESKASEERYVNNRIKDAEDFGKTKFGEQYDEIMLQAQEVIEGKVELPAIIDRESLSTKLVEAIRSKEVDLEKISDYVVGIAKLNPRFGKPKETNSVKKETNENIDRILKNESKQKTSASVGGGSGRRVVSYDDLTVEEAARLSTEQWRRLPQAVKERLLS
jgi:hypothetical protein